MTTDCSLTAFFPGQRGYVDAYEARDDGVRVASAGPYASHFHLAADCSR